MNKLHIVEPFPRTYTVENIYTGMRIEGLSDLSHVLYYARDVLHYWKNGNITTWVYYRGNRYDLFTNSRCKHPHCVYSLKLNDKRGYFEFEAGGNNRPLIVYDNLGELVPVDEIRKHSVYKPEYRGRDSWRTERFDLFNSNLVKKKGDARKVKTNWKTSPYVDMFGDVAYDYYARSYRRVRTQNELTANEAHRNEYAEEYGDKLVRKRRGKRYVPDSWDDVRSSQWRSRKCWKNYSKRRKQWVPKE